MKMHQTRLRNIFCKLKVTHPCNAGNTINQRRHKIAGPTQCSIDATHKLIKCKFMRSGSASSFSRFILWSKVSNSNLVQKS